jgi:hypothetical protein
LSDAARGNADWGFIVEAELTDRAYVLSADGYLFAIDVDLVAIPA